VYIIDCSKRTLNCYNKVVEGEHEKKRNEYLLAHYGFSTKFNVNEPGNALIISAKLKK